jgi:microcystin-dependent protein
MWSGVKIPEGWAVCNGSNGTPNLIGKFIKASDSANTTGGSNSITLSVDNLPDHQHKISEMNTLLSGGSVHSHIVPS